MSQPSVNGAQQAPALYSRADCLRQSVLEKAANLMLAGLPRDREYPWYREYRLAELSQQGRRVVAAPGPSPATSADYRSLYLRILGRLPLSRRQRLAFRLSVRGHSCDQIAALLGVTAGHVRNLNRQTRERLRAAIRAEWEYLLSPQRAWRETYREEVGRRGYVREKHCPTGQEECRRSGLCTRRWYLYFTEDQPYLPEETDGP